MYRVLGLLLMAMLGGCALHTATSGGVAVTGAAAAAEPRFSAAERRDLHDYFATKTQRTSPAPARRETLSPDTRGQPLPAALERRWPRLPRGYLRAIVGADVLLIKRDTRQVVDGVYGVVP